jgi:hypothetical protein
MPGWKTVIAASVLLVWVVVWVIDAASLLAALQGQLRLLLVDLQARVDDDGEVRGRLEREWKAAFDAERTGRTFEVWRDDRLTQVAVGWLLACVFVRFCEDNGLIAEPRISGSGDRGAAARVVQQQFFAARPHDSDREYLHDIFRSAATLPGLDGLLQEGESALWLVDPPADACTRLITLFREADDEETLLFDFTDPQLTTRFFGDLYQDLSEQARTDYALFQTPEFVEEFILDRTLTPAIETFGLANTTLIDPTCGSGHFLLGAFDRLFTAWRTAQPVGSVRDFAQRALDQITGVDLNPFAVAIARFRLLLAAVGACGIRDLRDAPKFTIDIAIGDSLLWDQRGELAVDLGWGGERRFLYATEHAESLRRIFSKQYAAVVGNPPYIIARDKALNAQYRKRFPKSCSGKYSLAAPFMECFFDLARTPDGIGSSAGFVGLITANSFMKREFGKKLVKECVPHWDLTHIIDSSGAYIPGHGTPTVILFGRHQEPVLDRVRAVMGIRGEASIPADPSDGVVWSAILRQIDDPGSESDYVSADDVDRSRFCRHPWSIGGGGAAELKLRLDGSQLRLTACVESIGITSFTLEDEIYLLPSQSQRRERIDQVRPMVEGECIRDYGITPRLLCVFPYNEMLEPQLNDVRALRHLGEGEHC